MLSLLNFRNLKKNQQLIKVTPATKVTPVDGTLRTSLTISKLKFISHTARLQEINNMANSNQKQLTKRDDDEEDDIDALLDGRALICFKVNFF